MRKTKILFMLSSMNIGGVEKSLLSLLSIIPKDKYDVTILLLEKKGGFLDSIPEWVRIEETTWFEDVKPIIMESPKRTLKNYMNKKQYINIPSFVCSYLISKYLDNRFVYYQHVLKSVPHHINTYDVAVSYQGPTDIIDYYIANKVTATQKISWVHFDVYKHMMNQKLYEKLYKRFDKIFVVSKEAKNHLIAKIPTIKNKTDVFNNIVSSKIIHNMSKEPINLYDGFKGMKIVTVGRLSKEKGQDIAIYVLYKLLQEGYQVRWYCVGEGSARKEYERLIHQYNLVNDFILLGSTPNPYPIIANADIYVQTSRHEGYCLTLAEAKCLSKPIVTTNFTGANEQIKDGYNGFIVENDEGLYEKIKYMIDNPFERNRLIKTLTTINCEETTPKVFNI
ncbi:glycosyltransferase [Paenibacillus sp. sgz302251]|uniref:glycosyltransferase n=1 Tax=Paenibacillus sp. sgz302251 TaxID=3414493 RepID=UPI003C7A3847